MRTILAAVLPVALAACGASSTGSPETGDLPRTPTQAPLGQPFDVGAGKTASVDGTGLRITFEAVTADSRCPSTAICVWQGDAAVALRLARDSRTVIDTLHT